MDYERALMNSFAAYFPTAELHGCFFDLVQNMKKHVQDCGLTKKYRTDPDLALQARFLIGLKITTSDGSESDLKELFRAEMRCSQLICGPYINER